MSLINVSLNVTAYADEPKTTNPLVKFADFSWSMLGMPTKIPKQVNYNLAPGETKQIMSTARTLSFNGSTSFTISQLSDGVTARLAGNFGARTARVDGDGTTEWELTVSNKLVKLRATGVGTAPTFGGMAAGDGVYLGSLFSPLNQGYFQVVKVGADYIQFVNAIAQDETLLSQVEIYSSGPVQVGDVLDISSTQFSFPNRGQFQITAVTDSYVDFKSMNAVPEAGITGVTTGLTIYSEYYKWLMIASEGRIQVRFNSDSTTGCEVEPEVPNDFSKNPGLLLKRGKVFELTLSNPTLDVIDGVVLLAE